MKDLPTLEELHSMVFSLDVDSAPSPDGFGAGFYQSCLSIIKDDLMEAVQDFFKGMQQLSPSWLSFLKWRVPLNGRTFDRLACAIQFGFDEQVVGLLFRTFSNSWFSILINGEPSGFFKSTQGVREGDPFSPALFLFVAELLGRGLQQLCATTSGRYYVSVGSRVPYLAFADDTIIFTRCSVGALTSIRDFLQLYQSCPGQKVLSLPGAVVASLGKIWNALLWDNSIEFKRIHWAAWENWYLRENKTIWVTFVHIKYIKGNHTRLVAVDRPSAVWCRLVKVKDLAEGDIRWSLGEGLIDFWHDRWCTDVPLATLVPGLAHPDMLVGELYRTSEWDKHRLWQILPGHIVTQILKLQIFPCLKDKMVWGASSSGDFSVASAWEHVCCKRNLSTVHSLVRSSVVPLKVAFFTWRLLHRWVPLDHDLQQKRVVRASRCGCYGNEVEMRSHLFVMVSVASKNHIRVIIPLLVLRFMWRARNQA
nr:uncharacterized protein LOC113704511 [Coffea arabica]